MVSATAEEPVTAGGEVAAPQEHLAVVEAPALAKAETWWSLIVERVRAGPCGTGGEQVGRGFGAGGERVAGADVR